MMRERKPDPFLVIYPNIDIHGEESATADLIIKNFIKDNYNEQKEKIVIIHGKGKGILREKVHEVARKSPYVASFYLEYPNTGCTVITLKKQEKVEKYTHI